ncbi:hydrolase CocE/NonD family protein [Croceitalea dokdonensis DOKDO 023]|uniref:Hydrolase CocE/NonD family protein n=1 Tax=Croceitalea dokdonensis DOKDO 023 TaxID=1300341 RepID=A0A0P7AZN3_9FLAO|nr:hydrolase CocE/NonD family protein [Croceitalea dokdonensis DOKDO 023]
MERSHFIKMRDGARLSTDLYFPVDYEGKLPVILERTPYDKANRRIADPEAPITMNNQAYYYASHGFVFAVQDRRGKFESEGDYTIGYGDVNDAYDTLEWFEKQDWFNGNVGMIGCSIPGGNVIKAGMSQHKSLKGLVPQSAGFGHGTAGGTMARGFLRGGVQNMWMPLWTHGFGSKLFYRPSKRLNREEYLKVADRFDFRPNVNDLVEYMDLTTGAFTKKGLETIMHLPLVEIDDLMGSPPSDWDNLISKPPMDPWWLAGDYLEDEDAVSGGALHVNSWHDYSVHETMLQFEHFSKKGKTEWDRENQYAIIGPLGHCRLENLTSNTINVDRELGDARFDAWGTYLKWWDYTLKGNKDAFEGTPKIQYFLPGANEWRSSDEWPIAGTVPTKLYLSSNGSANTRLGDGSLNWEKAKSDEIDEYEYDPSNPVGNFEEAVNQGSSDMSELELRKDILVYSTSPLEEDIEMTGKIRAKIWVSTNVPDTDLALKLVDVYPDGRAYAIKETYLRLRYRDGYDKTVMMEPGKIYPIELGTMTSANLFKKGHQIRIEITSSNFPTFARNLNTGGNNATETEFQKANVKILHGKRHPSHIELPIIKR